jgi:mycothiol system anti-sigma-R factor
MSFVDWFRKRLGGAGNGGSPSGDDGDSHGCESIPCMDALSKVHEYLDGELEGVSQEEVRRHFEICKKCYPHLKLEERFREVMLRVGAEEKAPDHLRLQVLELLAAESEKGG